MSESLDQLYLLANDIDFARFQNQLAESIYETLAASYDGPEREEEIVKRLVEAVNGKSFKSINIYANMLHGRRSFVDFKYRNVSITKELGDMAIVTLITNGAQKVLQRVSIIQNKKERDQSWAIDKEQLFLLKNFPSFTAKSGVVRKMPRSENITFKNATGCLGSYGLFASPGEMAFCSANLLSSVLCDKQRLRPDDLRVLPNDWSSFVLHKQTPLIDKLTFMCPGAPVESFQGVFKPILPHHLTGPFRHYLGNTLYCGDIYDFVRNWTQVNIGEYAFFNRTINTELDDFVSLLVHEARIGKSTKGYNKPEKIAPAEENVGDNGDMGVFVLHIDLEGLDVSK